MSQLTLAGAGQGVQLLGGSGDPYWANVALLFGNILGLADGSTTATDQSQYGRTLTVVGNAQVDTAQYPSGMDSAWLLDGVGDRITFADNANLEPDSASFTLEGLVRFSSIVTPVLIGHRASNAAEGFTIIVISNELRWYASSDGVSFDIGSAKVFGSVTTNVWYHWAWVRDGTAFTPYLDGVAGTGTATSSAAIHDSSADWCIGSELNGDNALAGWEGVIRYTPGVARYTGNFTPPTPPLPSS